MSNQSDPLDKRNLIEADASTVGKYVGLYTPANLYNKLVRYIQKSDESKYITKKLILTEAQVRELNSANESYGIELLPPPGENKVYQVENIIVKFKQTGGTLLAQALSVYGYNSDDEYGQITPVEASKVHFLQKSPALKTSENEAVYLWANIDSPNYEGTAVIVFDYRVIEL
jgi:hypothetical protein